MILEILEHDDLPVILGQTVERGAHDSLALACFEILEGRRGRTGYFAVFVLVIDRDVTMPARDEIETVILDDAVQPGVERPRLVEARPGLVRLDERLLRQVAG